MPITANVQCFCGGGLVAEASEGDVASVTIDGATYTYTSLAEAVDYANSYSDDISDGNGIVITMLDNADTDAALEFTNTTNAITLDMNGKTIDRGLTESDADADGYVIKVNSDVTVTITSGTDNGSGTYGEGMGTITGGYCNGNGGGVNNAGTLTINNIEISGNKASSNGGGIYNAGTLTITDSTITGNYAGNNGGGVYIGSGTVSLSYVDITDNTAVDSHGGGMYIGGNSATIEYSNIIGNTASGSGGGIYFTKSDSTLDIEHSTISGNTASSGGGVYIGSGTVTLDNVEVSYNTSGSDAWNCGGGIYINNSDGSLIAIDSTISYNTSGSGDCIYGGGIYCFYGTLTIGGSTTVTGNTEGGTVSGDATDGYSLEGGTANNIYLFSGKTITFDDADDTAFTGTVGVSMYTTSANISTTYGGTGTVFSDNSSYIVMVNDDTLALGDESSALATVTIGGTAMGFATLADAVTYANEYTAVELAEGEVILITMLANADTNSTGALEFANTTNAITLDMAGFEIDRGLESTQSVDAGHVIYVYSDVTVTITSSVDGAIITGGYCNGNGGGIENDGTLTIENITITGNTASYGGGIYNEGTLTITDCDVTNNTVTSSGGGIYTNEGTAYIEDSNITTNNATSNGGGIKNHRGEVTIIDSEITNNTAEDYGGGISNNGTLTVGGTTTVTGNTVDGSVNNVYLWSTKTVEFDEDNAFAGNIGITMGVTTGVVSNTATNVNGATITSDISGLEYTVNGDTASLTSVATVTIDGNVTYYASLAAAVTYANNYKSEILDGKGIFITMLADADITSTLTFDNTTNTITINMAGHTIDANGECKVMHINGATVIITSIDGSGDYTSTMGTITGGYNSSSGGGIFNYGILTLYNIEISANTSSSGGGGIYNTDTLTVIDSTITDNTASIYGGGIYNGSTLTVGGSTIVTGNTNSSGADSNIRVGGDDIIKFDQETPFVGEIGVTYSNNSTGIISSSWNYAGTGATVTSDSSSYYIAVSTTDVTNDTLTLAKALASVTIGDTTTGFGSLADAVTYANTYTDVDNSDILITMLADADTSSTGALEFTNTTNAITLDMNGKTIDRGLSSATSNGYVIYVASSGVTLTITSTVATMGTITGGNNSSTGTSTGGGGILNKGTLTITNISITGNTAGFGGGIMVYSGTLYAEYCSITGNSATSYGGGISIYYSGEVTITNSTITGNTAKNSGGGIALWLGTLNIYGDTTVTDNHKTDGTTTNNIYLASGKTIAFSGTDDNEFTGTVGVTMYSVSDNISTTWDNAGEGATVTSDNSGYRVNVSADGTTLSLVAISYVTFDSNDGSSTSTIVVDTNSTITEPDDPTYNGYTFDGWYASDSATAFDFDTAITEDITLTAKWTLNSYTITYVTVESVTTNSNVTSYTVEDETITLADATVTGAGFLGWYDADGSEVTSIAKGSFGDITLYAYYSVTAPTADSTTYTYTGSEQTYGIVSGDLYSVEGNVKTNADTYTVTVTLADNCYWSDTTTADLSFSFTIAKADTVIDTTDVVTSYTYSGALQTIDSGATINHSESSIVYSDNTFTAVGTGSYTITISVADSTNYNGTSTTVDVSVAKAVYDMSGVTFEGSTVTYSGSAHALAIGGTLPTGVTVTYTGNSNTDVGSYTVTASFAGDTDNYELIADMTAKLTINAVVVDTDTETNTEEGNTLWWIILILAVAFVAEVILINKRLKKNKNNNNSTRTYSVAPFMLLLAIPMWETVSIVALSALVLVAGIVLIVICAKRGKSDNTVVASQPKVVVATPSGAVEKAVEAQPATVSATEAPMLASQTAQAETSADNQQASTVVAGVVAISAPKVASDDEVGFGGIDEATGKAIIIRYSKSFTAKLIQSDDIIQGYYTELKNALHSYNGTKSRISWKWDSINVGRTKLAKFGIRGKSLYMYLALDPAELADTKYKVTTATAKAYVATPCLYKVSGPRKLKFALELVAMLATKLALTEGTAQCADYHKPYETTEALLEQKLIKELISKKKYQAYMDKYQDATGDRKFVRASEVSIMMSTEQATAEMTATTVQYASEVASSSATVTKSKYKAVGNKTAVVNVDTLSNCFGDGDTVTIDILKAKGLIAKNTAFVKVLARGVCYKSLTVVAHDFSIDAVKMILLTNGKAIKVAK